MNQTHDIWEHILSPTGCKAQTFLPAIGQSTLELSIAGDLGVGASLHRVEVSPRVNFIMDSILIELLYQMPTLESFRATMPHPSPYTTKRVHHFTNSIVHYDIPLLHLGIEVQTNQQISKNGSFRIFNFHWKALGHSLNLMLGIYAQHFPFYLQSYPKQLGNFSRGILIRFSMSNYEVIGLVSIILLPSNMYPNPNPLATISPTCNFPT